MATGLGLAVAAGFNAWAALLVFSAMSRLFPAFASGSVAQFLASGPMFTLFLALFLAEFLADKIPFLDHFWNFAHTFLRPAAGGALVLACLPRAGPPAQVGAALAGVLVTLLAHVAKTTSRLTSTAAVSGLSQIAVSVAEDVIAVSIAAVALFSPTLSIAVVLALILLVTMLYERVRQAVRILLFLGAHPRKLLKAARDEEPPPGLPGE
jgi:hypothetical protein